MSILNSVREAIKGPKSSPNESSGAFWCDDCDVRQVESEVDIEAEGDTPSCPECGQSMRFERSKGRSCAC